MDDQCIPSVVKEKHALRKRNTDPDAEIQKEILTVSRTAQCKKQPNNFKVAFADVCNE